MRVACAIVLVVGITIPAIAQDERGWGFSGSFNSSANSDSIVLKLAPLLDYTFNKHFETYAGLPFYFVNVPSSTATTTSTTSTSGGFMNGLGNAFVGGRLTIDSESVTYSSTLELTAPTGDKTRGFSTGRVTADWANRFSHRFNSFTPFGSAGLANTISDTNFFVRPFTSLGLVSHFEGGGTYDISSTVRVSGSAYAIRASGDQTIISRVTKRQTASVSSSAGSPATPTRSKASAKASANRVFNNTTQTVVPSQVANDNGLSTWIGVSPRQESDFYIGYSRSMHYDYNTLFFGVGFRFGK